MSREPDFEDAFERLEEIVEELEGRDVGLDEALELYEEGVELVSTCRERLEEAEEKLEVLGEDEG